MVRGAAARAQRRRARLRAALLQLPRHDAARAAARSTTRPTGAARGWCSAWTSSTPRCAAPTATARRAARVIVLAAGRAAARRRAGDRARRRAAPGAALRALRGRRRARARAPRRRGPLDRALRGLRRRGRGDGRRRRRAAQAPGSLGHVESAIEESFSEALGGAPEYPHYTRPASYRGWKVPEVLLSGDHERVREWRRSAKREPPCGVPRGLRRRLAGSCLLSDAARACWSRAFSGPPPGETRGADAT